MSLPRESLKLSPPKLEAVPEGDDVVFAAMATFFHAHVVDMRPRFAMAMDVDTTQLPRPFLKSRI